MTSKEAAEAMVAGGWCRPKSWTGGGVAITYDPRVGLVEVPNPRGGVRAHLYSEMLTEEWEHVDPQLVCEEASGR